MSKRKCVLPAPPAVATRIVHRFLKVGQNARPVPISERAGEKRHEAAVVAAVATCTSSSGHNIRQWHGGPCLCVALLARPRPTLQLTLHSILRLREPPFSRAGGREETGRSRARSCLPGRQSEQRSAIGGGGGAACARRRRGRILCPRGTYVGRGVGRSLHSGRCLLSSLANPRC